MCCVEKRKKKQKESEGLALGDKDGGCFACDGESSAAAAGGDVSTVVAAKEMKYEELFPVEYKKFGYDPANKCRACARAAGGALDDRVKKKADHYCK
ncbi:hypothetical protein AXF42_Ash020623 [Apostasia shenzhenica]|uniref:Uncharacterized protein n=1 Tax=Apostasia shenzhenica TaxID=1088818 RepID=A0A2H9ZY74_9ASPA|nr:hypothetical protein AXF42_Ash020623 [Apostasia shenzhenica]